MMKLFPLKHKFIQFSIIGVIFFVIIMSGLALIKYNETKDPLTVEERQWLSENNEIKIADGPDWAPIAFKDEKGIFRGISADYIALIEEKLSFKFKRVLPKDWAEMIRLVEKKEIDVIGAIQKTSKRSKFLNFTEPHLNLRNVIIVRKNIKNNFNVNELKGKKIAVGEGFSVTEHLKEKHPYLKLNDDSKDDYSILKKVISNEVDVGISDLAAVSYNFEKNAINNLRIAGEVEDYNMVLRIASRNDWPILNQILAKGLELITPRERKAIWKKWVTIEYSGGLPWYIPTLIGAIFVIALITLLFNRILKRKVITKTQELRESEKKYRQIFENAAEGIFQTYLDGRLKTANPAFAKILGYESVEDVLNKIENVSELYKISEKRDEMLALIVKNERVIDFEVEGNRKDNKNSHVLINARIIEDEKESYLEGTIVDITDKKEQERLKLDKEAVEKAMKEKNLFIANMSHDIRTPMNAIIGYSQILAEQILEKQHKYYISKIISNGKSLIELIDDILLLTIDDIKTINFDNAPVNIRTIFTEVRDMHFLRCKEKSLDFFIDIDPNLPKIIMLDRKPLKRILLNLVSNSVKFTDAGYIKLSAYCCSEKIEKKCSLDLNISVEDTGSGIPVNQEKKIFELFTQGVSQESKESAGTGLGLAIVHRWVQKMGGRIYVDSKVEIGSTFHIKLKNILISECNHEESLEFFENSSIIFKGSTILHIEDKEDNREVIRDYLKPYNLKLIEAINGKDGVNCAICHKPDLILMDIMMPKMDGYEATRQLKTGSKFKDVPVIAISASATEEDVKKSGEAGCVTFLRKPVEKWKLIELLTNYLPHTINQTTSRKTENEWAKSTKVVERLPELLRNLENNFRAKWEDIKKRWVKGKAKKFAEEIRELANLFLYTPLVDWAEELLEKMNSGDYGSAHSVFCNFPQQLEKINGYSKKKF